MKYRPDIDGLRTIAVVPVVIFHIMASLVPGGFIGVDIFFVISGYLIGSILWHEVQEDRMSILTFYERRIRRIFPALFATLIVTYAVAYLLYMPIDFRGFSAALASAVLFFSNVFYWWNTGYFDLSTAYKPLIHTWSLAVEEQYYTVYPILLLLLHRHARRYLVPILIGLALSSFATSVVQVARWPQAAFYLPFGRFWELLVGALLAVGAVPHLRNQNSRNIAATSGLALILFSSFTYSEQTPFPGVSALLPVVGTALIIHAGEAGSSWVGRILSTSPMIFIGRLSYSLYLVHWPVMAFFRYSTGGEPAGVEAVALFILMLLLAWFSYRFVESPFRQGHLRKMSYKPLFAMAGTLGLVLVGVGAVGYLMKGVPERLDPQTQKMALAAFDTNPLRKRCDQRSPAQVADNTYCVEGADDAQDPTFAFLGDSFGDALAPGIIKAASEADQKGMMLTYSGCYPMLGLNQRGDCRAFMDAAAAAIERQPSVTTLVLTARWTSAYLGTRFGEQNETGWFLTDDQSAERSYEETKRVFERGLTRTLERFRGYNISIIYGFPEQDRNIPRTLGVDSNLGRPLYPGIPRTIHEARQTELRDVLTRFQARYGFRLIDATDHFCDHQHCRVMENATVLYADDNHISRKGAETLVDVLRPLLADPTIAMAHDAVSVKPPSGNE